MSHLLPNIPRNQGLVLRGVATSSGTSSRSVAAKFGFAQAAESAEEVINDPETGTVFVATRHDSHAGYVQSILAAGKNVFVEKPLCLNETELEQILRAWEQKQPILMVGFNRRFSPLAKEIKAQFGDGPMSMLYRVNAGPIPRESWIQDPEIGGGRIIGEVCHFIDLLTFINGSLPLQVHAYDLSGPDDFRDTVTISLRFENGSIGTICYFANGPKSLSKEYIEVFKGGMVARLMDFKALEILGGNKPIRRKLFSQDKGQKTMVEEFMRAVSQGLDVPIPIAEAATSTACTLAALTSLSQRAVVDVKGIDELLYRDHAAR